MNNTHEKLNNTKIGKERGNSYRKVKKSPDGGAVFTTCCIHLLSPN